MSFVTAIFYYETIKHKIRLAFSLLIMDLEIQLVVKLYVHCINHIILEELCNKFKTVF